MPFRILSLDGGGIRGLVAAKILATIEKQIQQPLNKYFNLISGTSTGSILAAAVATGSRSEKIVELYKQKSSVIFPYKSRFSLQRIPLLIKYGLSIYSAIDGGVAANNPSACAVAEALRLGYKVEEITVLSIGTGDRTRIIPFEKAQGWGLIEWAQPLIGVLLEASSDIYEYITNQVMHQRVLRLQFKLDRELTGKRLSDDIDDVSEENINNLIEAAEVYINQPYVQSALQQFLEISQ
jgi:patatin-like phospholipase/acyl hydrolase